MPIMYTLDERYAFHTEGESWTEQDHVDSCDINIMIKNAHRGLSIRGASSEPIYGEENMNMDALQFRIQKEKLETELSEISKTTEFSDEELKHIPESVKSKFKFKSKKSEPKKTAQNDEQTEQTTNQAQNQAPTPPLQS